MPRISLIHKQYGEIDFQYSPDSIEYASQAGWSKRSVPGVDDPLITWAGGQGFTITLEAQFTGKTGRDRAETLSGATRANPWSDKKGKGADAPPIWTLYIGSKFYAVIVDEVSRIESHFGGKGLAQLVTARVTLTKYIKYAVSAQ